MAKVVNLWIKYFWPKKGNKKLLVTIVPTGLLPRVRSMWRETRFQLGEGVVGRVSREREERSSEEKRGCNMLPDSRVLRPTFTLTRALQLPRRATSTEHHSLHVTGVGNEYKSG